MNKIDNNSFLKVKNNLSSFVNSALNKNIIFSQIPDFRRNDTYLVQSSVIALVNQETLLSKYVQKIKHIFFAIHSEIKIAKSKGKFNTNLLMSFFCGFVAAMTLIAIFTLFL